MVVVIMVACLILSFLLSASARDGGVAPRNRGSMRYQQRKANRLGVGFDQVIVNPRVQRNYDPGVPLGKSHLADTVWNLLVIAGSLFGAFFGFIVLVGLHLQDWFFPFLFAQGVVIYWAGKARQQRWNAIRASEKERLSEHQQRRRHIGTMR